MIIMLIIIIITLPFYVTQRSSTYNGLKSILKGHSILSQLLRQFSSLCLGISISKKYSFFQFQCHFIILHMLMQYHGNHNATSEFFSTQCDIAREFLRDAIVLSSSGEFYYCTLQKLSTYPRRCGVCCCGRRCRRFQGLRIYKKKYRQTFGNMQTCLDISLHLVFFFPFWSLSAGILPQLMISNPALCNTGQSCNLVTIFQRPFFNLLHKIIQFSDIMQFSDSFC